MSNPRRGATATRPRPMRRLATLTLAGSLSMALTTAVAPPVFAADDPHRGRDPRNATLRDEADRRCSPGNFFRFHSFKPRNFFVPRTRFIDGPGGTMTASVRRQHRVYFEVEIEREKNSEIDRLHRDSTARAVGTTTFTDEDTRALLRRLRNNVNPLLAEELIVETGHDYTQEVSDGMYGNLWYRVFGYRVGFSSWHQLEDCTSHLVATGIASVPARVEGWRYWETKHPMYKGRRLSDK
ncbi:MULTISPECIES: hypothetical protein [Streptosporangium]|uniref:Uncharacterized protein n=1 Tax=Streptosporangium brasiliense TaxID=47480 RepID=A0ABT9R5C8_9ACTN|nr:hypothetical protein [Streptosporangium brasiliense]MDP9864446.1 hypothetical protein [Streptosporangium brasiliense]